MKRLLVISHAGVVDVNRALFQTLSKITELEIKMIVPDQWKGSLIKNHAYEKDPQREQVLEVIPVSVFFSGNGSLYFYKINLREKLKLWTPDFVFLDEEPWSLCALQVFISFFKIKKAFYTKQNLKKRLPFPFNVFEKFIFSHSTMAFVVADEVGKVLEKWKYFLKPIKYLPHSYDPELFYKRSLQEKKELRNKFQIPNKALIVGYFGRISFEKGLDDLVEAICLSKDKITNLFLFIVGDGPLFEDINKKISHFQLGKVIKALPHSNVAEALSCIDLLILPSKTTRFWKEQFGRVLIEAAGCGIPLLGSDSGEIPHLISKMNGGEIFREGDILDLSQKIIELLSDSEKLLKLGDQGYLFASKNFTHLAIAHQLANLLEVPVKNC